MVTKEEEWEGINWEFGINIYTLLYIKQIINRDLCIAQGTLLNTQCSEVPYGKKNKTKQIHA